jgi:hypothetical protein
VADGRQKALIRAPHGPFAMLPTAAWILCSIDDVADPVAAFCRSRSARDLIVRGFPNLHGFNSRFWLVLKAHIDGRSGLPFFPEQCSLKTAPGRQ